jgi:hypothetical protein
MFISPLSGGIFWPMSNLRLQNEEADTAHFDPDEAIATTARR